LSFGNNTGKGVFLSYSVNVAMFIFTFFVSKCGNSFDAKALDISLALSLLKLQNITPSFSSMPLYPSNATANIVNKYSYLLTSTGGSFLSINVALVTLNHIIYFDNIILFNISTLISNKQYSPIFNTTFDLMSDADIKTQMDAWVTSGELPNDNIQSVSGNKRYKAVGKNLFDGNTELGTILTSTGVESPSSTKIRTSYIKVKPSTTYIMSSTDSTNDDYKYFYDIDKVFISTSFNAKVSFTTPSNCRYVRFIQDVGTTNIQLEQGSTATTYVPYTSTEMYLQPNQQLNRVPNGVKDTIEYRNGKFYHVKRVHLDFNNILRGVTWIKSNEYTNTIGVYFDVAILGIGVTANNATLRIDNTYITRDSYANVTNNDVLAYGISDTLSPNRFYVRFNKATIGGNLASHVYAYLQTVDVEILYQLATPIETEITSIGQLLGGDRYTVYVDSNIIQPQATVYTTNAVIKDSDYPISALDTIIRWRDGVKTTLATSGATIAGDGLSFTHTDLTSGDIVIFTYYYANDNSVVGNTVIKYYSGEDDLRFPVTVLTQPASGRPDFDTTNIGLLFPQNNTAEVVYIVAQMPHDRAMDSDIEPHVHCRLSGAGQPVMKIDYKWYNANEATIPSSFTTYTMNVNTATWSTGTISNMIYGSAPISGVGKTESSILIMKLYRDDNVYTGDLLVDEFDIHYYRSN